MKSIFGFLYGLNIAVVLYGLSWIIQKMIFKMKYLSLMVILPRYFLYWFLLKNGFILFSSSSVIFGMVFGIYSGLTFFYFVNKKNLEKKNNLLIID